MTEAPKIAGFRAPRAVVFAAALMVGALTLGGCAPQAAGRLDEYRAEAERITAELVAAVPAELIVETQEPVSEARGLGPTHVGPEEAEPAWWQVSTFLLLDAAPGATETAVDVVSAALVADGWSRGDDSAAPRPATDHETETFSRAAGAEDRWRVEVVWTPEAEGRVQSLTIIVRSPVTIRGDRGLDERTVG